MMTISRKQARQFILSKQGLLGQHRFTGKEGAYRYVCQAGCIQYDPVDVCGRNAELTLQSRVKGFTRQMLADLLYQDRLLIDYADKELSILPAKDWPYFSGYRDRSRMLGETFEGLDALKKEALEYIREHGPVSGDTLPIRGEIYWHSSMHWSGNWHKKSPAARSVLEQLYTDGLLVIHHKNGSRKFYDLVERHLDPALLNAVNPCAEEEELLCWRVLRRIGAVGLLWDRNSTAFLGIPLNAETRRRVLHRLEENGQILPVRTEDIRSPFFFRAEDEPLLQSVLTDSFDQKARLEFLAPLDPMLWDKTMIEALWNFRYAWEIYTPASQRKYGYYTLPVLWGDRFVGRIEAVADRKAGTLLIKHFWPEPGIRLTKKLHTAVAGAAGRLARFNGCSLSADSFIF